MRMMHFISMNDNCVLCFINLLVILINIIIIIVPIFSSSLAAVAATGGGGGGGGGDVVLPTISRSKIEFLPGFQGRLPFEFETGYIGVGESEDVQLFYYFAKSEGNPKEDPLLFWTIGGPGGSSFTGVVYEQGPICFEEVRYNGSMPTLLLDENRWTKVASILWVDLPVGAGYSYARTLQASQSDDYKSSDQAYEFIKKWLLAHPEFISNSFYVGGDSYAGIPVSRIAQLISNGNEDAMEQFINFKGYILGNPVAYLEDRYKVLYAHGMGLISNELYESLMRNCGGDLASIDPDNVKCVRDADAFNELTKSLGTYNILDPLCVDNSSIDPRELLNGRRALNERLGSVEQLHGPPKEYDPCDPFNQVDLYALSDYWNNYECVREALHIRKGTRSIWRSANHDLPYEMTIKDIRPYHANLSAKGYRSLIYSGDHDMVVPFQSTEAWIKGMNYSIVDDWRPWLVSGQVAGYTRTYANKMTFATVKGAGHVAPEYKPEECSTMFKRWISYQPL